MAMSKENEKAFKEGTQGGPAQKNQNAQAALGAERQEKSKSGVKSDEQKQDQK